MPRRNRISSRVGVISGEVGFSMLVLAVLATAQIVHAYPGMLSPSRSITAGSTIIHG